MARRRFQQGSLFKRGTRQKLWVARWWEEVIKPDGSIGRSRRAEVLGTVAELGSRSRALGILFVTRMRRCWTQQVRHSGRSRLFWATQLQTSLAKSTCTPYRKISAGRWRASKRSYLDSIGVRRDKPA
jgi:hypothetical protein